MTPQHPFMEPDEPMMIGRYLPLYRIATGATGYVYAADDPTLGRRVALKVIARDPRTIRKRVNASIARLASPSSCGTRTSSRCSRSDRTADARSSRWNCSKGWRSTSTCANVPTLSLEARLDLIIQLCTGLEVAHAEGVVHRDAANQHHGAGDGRLKILDFGLARLHTSTLTANGAVVGSSGYMSPEQAEGRRVDERSDIFRLLPSDT